MESKVPAISEQDYRLLRADAVADLLALGRATVYNMMASGELPTIRVGRSVRVPAHRLREWIDENATGATAKSLNG